MAFNKLEKRAMSQISLNEGIVSTIAKFFLGKKFRTAMSELERMKKDDPEFAAGMASMAQNYKILDASIKRICKDRPNHPACK